MPARVRVAELQQVPPGTSLVRAVLGRPVALFNVDGTIFATANTCPHRGGPLGEGSLAGPIVTCPLHGWQFDVTSGECVGRPSTRVPCLAVCVEADEIFIEFAGPEKPLEDTAAGQEFLVRFGAMGHVGRFRATEPVECSRGSRVVVQSSRGLEIGEVLLMADSGAAMVADQPDSGLLIRTMNEADTDLERLIRQGQQRAFEACRQLLNERNVPVELVDAEQLFDGQTLIFYFIGDPPPELADVTAELAGQYEARVQFRPFGDDGHESCGEGCQRESGGQCGGCDTDGGCERHAS